MIQGNRSLYTFIDDPLVTTWETEIAAIERKLPYTKGNQRKVLKRRIKQLSNQDKKLKLLRLIHGK